MTDMEPKKTDHSSSKEQTGKEKPFFQSKPGLMFLATAHAALFAATIIIITNLPQIPEESAAYPEYKNIPSPEAAVLVKRINNMAANFAEHYSSCALASNHAERYLKTHKLISSFADSALLKSVDGETFVNDLEHAMLKQVRIIPTELPQGVLGVFYDDADNGKDVLAIQNGTTAIYGAFPQFFNYLSNQNFNTGGHTVVMSTKATGKYEMTVVTDSKDIKINDQQMADSLSPALRFSQPCQP